MYLETINQPADVKRLTASQRKVLAQEMRDALLKKLSLRGGHFGSNFGMVEATIALHSVFDSPKDKFVFDVSHQSYCHKMLTGRKDAFLYADKYGDVSGYTCPEESVHDLFNIGHTATSISLACGLAKARDIMGGKENVVAIIGDGALSGGEAYEGLDYAWELHSNLIIVVNDNGMSISDNHGGLYQNLKLLRETSGAAPCNFFKALGFDYRFVENGNAIEPLIRTFQEVRNLDHPVVVHICTQKGKGYAPAEANKEMWHWRPPFDITTGNMKRAFGGESYDTVLRDYLLSKIEKDPSFVALVAAVPLSIRFTETERLKAGKQFVDVGIAEEHAVSMAAGIARAGGKAVFTTDCTFFQRTYDQIAQELCINRCPATLLVRNASVFGMSDITHLGIFDIPLLSNIPNLVYLAPTTKEEYVAMLDWSVEQDKHPVAIRIPRNGFVTTGEAADVDYGNLNRYKIAVNGSQIAILALGDFYQLGEASATVIQGKTGIRPTLVNPRYITGLDKELLRDLADTHTVVITLEDGVLNGGFGEKIASFYGPSHTRVLNYGLKKEFIDRYTVDEILKENRLTPEQIAEDVAALLVRS